MEWKVKEIIEKAKTLIAGNIRTRKTPSDIESEDLRATMRGQFKQLQKKGLSIRIISL